MARRKKKKAPKFTISNKDKQEFARLQRNAQNMVNRRKKKYKVDISGQIDFRESVESFSSRNEFNLWKNKMEKLRYRADLQITKTKAGTVASKSQIRRGEQQAKKALRDETTKVKGKKDTYVNKRGVVMKKGDIIEMGIQNVVAQDMERGRQKDIQKIVKFDRKGRPIKKPAQKVEKETEVHVRKDLDIGSITSGGHYIRKKKDLGKVSDPERYSRKEGQLKENQLEKMLWAFGDEAEDVRAFFNKMSDAEFNNFYFRFKQSSMGFDAYDSDQYLGESEQVDDKLHGALEKIRTDIEKYKKIREELKLVERF